MIYDADAQPLTTTFADYLLPSADEIPAVAVTHVESPTPINPLGVKGAGEGGTIPALAALVGAIEDALSPFGVRLDEVPITPPRLVELIAEAATRDG
jgi:carbon-monoxide dehydrogenase large subunit